MSRERTAQQDFRNRLCILRSIDSWELDDAGVDLSNAEWQAFRDNPYRAYLTLSDDDEARVWAIIERRSSLRVEGAP